MSGCSILGSGSSMFRILHLLFADDILVFFEAKDAQILYLSWILLWFEASPGMKSIWKNLRFFLISKCRNCIKEKWYTRSIQAVIVCK